MKKVCKMCGKKFNVSKNHRTLCSDECRKFGIKQSSEKQAKERREANRLLLGTRFCEVCGKEFQPRTRLMVRCSEECTKKRGTIYKRENTKKNRDKVAEEKRRKKNSVAERDEIMRQGMKAGRSYGKQQLVSYLANQSDEMAKRRRELDAEWERKRKNGNQ